MPKVNSADPRSIALPRPYRRVSGRTPAGRARAAAATQFSRTTLGICIRQILAGGVLALSGPAIVWAAPAGLPVSGHSLDANHAIADLTSPGLHAAGADLGSASAAYSADGHQLTINQTSHNVILDWNSYDIAAGNSVKYVQPDSSAAALNNIGGGNPSQILGSLSGNGQVYLVNSNGFVFGPNASVNLNSLVVSSLEISDGNFNSGIAKVAANNAPNSNLGSNSTASATAAFSNDSAAIYRNTANGREKIRILVESGADIAVADQGRVIMAAPEVINQGRISAPDGQVILAAATDKVYLQESTSADLRGLLVEVKTGGDVQNLGTILTERGNTTLLGFAVSQQGIISASTSVNLNGSIRLLARENGVMANAGSSNTNANFILEPTTTTRAGDIGDDLGTQAHVTLGAGSLTTVTLDDSGGKAVAALAQAKSKIAVEAAAIDMQGGAQIVAHGGEVYMNALQQPAGSGVNGLNICNIDPFSSALLNASNSNASRIVLESGSRIDVSGARDVQLSAADTVAVLKLYSYELRNDPLQNNKNSILFGQTVYANTRLGTALADISGAEANLAYSVAYRNTQAGTVNLNSEGDIVVHKDAVIDIAGGSVDVLAGYVQSTDLVSNGILYNIARADPNLIYTQLLTDSYYQSAYTQGAQAGSIKINSRDLLLDGTIQAGAVNGVYQRSQSERQNGGSLSIDTWSYLFLQDVEFQAGQSDHQLPSDASLPGTLYLSSALFDKGLSSLDLKTGGALTIDSGVQLKLPDFGNLSLQAGKIDIQGSISAHSGSVTLTTAVRDPSQSLNGQLSLAKNSVIDTSGLWINDFYAGLHAQPLSDIAIKAGDIKLQAQGDLLLKQGSLLSANGGAWLQYNQKLTGGAGGGISLKSAGLGTQGHTKIQLDGQLSAYALQNSGSLSVTADSFYVGASKPDTFGGQFLDIGLLQGGGFGSYQLTAFAGNLQIAAGSTLNLQQQNRQLNAEAAKTAGGQTLSTAMTVTTLLADSERNPVKLGLTLAQSGVVAYNPDLAISIGGNSRINADAKAELDLTSDANIRVAGGLYAPGGTINLSLKASPLDNIGYNPNQAIVLAAQSVLSTAGLSIAIANNLGLRLGEVLDGGTVSLTADRGYIVADAASLIDVSGSHALLDIVNTQGVSLENVASNAGAINLTAAEGMLLQGRFAGQAGSGVQSAIGGNATAAGGSLNIGLNAQNRHQPVDFDFPNGKRQIVVSNAALNLLSSAQIDSGNIPVSFNGLAYISAAQIGQGGFDRLKLASLVVDEGSDQQLHTPQPNSGTIVFNGDIDLSLKLSLELDSPLIGHTWNTAADSGAVVLNTDMFILGSSLNQSGLGSLSDPAAARQNNHSASLTVNAAYMELRGAALIDGFALTALNSAGDIDLIGVTVPATILGTGTQSLAGGLSLNGELDLSAREIFPSSMSSYSINIDAGVNPDGLVKILPATGSAYTPLSAAGKLAMHAANIDSGGNLIAPFGSIALNAAKKLTLESHSVTAVSAAGNSVIPFGQTDGNGLNWYYKVGGGSSADYNILSGAPQKAISLSAADIVLQNGASVNLNGGGDLMAYEFTPAPDSAVKSIDYLSPAYLQSYAILPNLKSAYAPYDYLQTAGSGLSLGENIHLSAGIAGLAAGDYVLLPAYYALLPGAFLITPQAGYANMAAGSSITRPDGVSVVAAYLETAGSHAGVSQWAGFALQAGSNAEQYSAYQLSYASKYFSSGSGTSVNTLPQDAGNLSLQATNTLALDGQILARAGSGGLGGQLDISGDNFYIGSGSSGQGDTVTIDPSYLNNLGVDSIFIGGLRSRSGNGTNMSVHAQSITLDSALSAPEIILAATGQLTLTGKAAVTANGSLSRGDSVLNISDHGSASTDGALLRVSNAAQAAVNRAGSGLQKLNGDLNIQSGASLSATGSIMLDASHDGRLLGDINMSKGELELRGGLITLGGAAEANAGFQLSASTLNSLHVEKLTLASYSTVNIADAFSLQLSNLSIDSAGIFGYQGPNQTATITATGTIELLNSANAHTGVSPGGSGQLALAANTIALGGGDYALNGFSRIELKAASAVIGQNSGNMSVNADMDVTAPVWTAISGADTNLNLGTHVLTASSSGQTDTGGGLGAKLSIAAGGIDFQGLIRMASGSVKLSTLGDLLLRDGGGIDTSGVTVSLGGNTIATDGGGIALSSKTGELVLQAGTVLDVSGAVSGGKGGSVDLSALAGNLNLSGKLHAHGYQGAGGGSLSLNALGYSQNFSAIAALWQTGSFGADFSLRQGLGDLLVSAGDQLHAANIALTADAGLLSVNGELNVGAAQGGEIQLAGQQGVTLGNTGRLMAVSSGDHPGGKVLLTSAPVSPAGSGVTIAAGAVVDVSGGGKGGTVQAVVNRTAGANGYIDDAAVNIDAAAIRGADSLLVEAMAHYVDMQPTYANIQTWYSDMQSFLDAASQNSALQARLGGMALQAGLDVQSHADLNLDLSVAINNNNWSQLTRNGNIYYTQLSAPQAGAYAGFYENGTALTLGTSRNLTASGSYFIDGSNKLYVYLNPLNNSNIFNPNLLRNSLNLVVANNWSWDFTLTYTRSLNGNLWSAASQDGNVWVTHLQNPGGDMSNLQESNFDQGLFQDSSSALSVDGSYFYDNNPNSATYQDLFVRLGNPKNGDYNPAHGADSLTLSGQSLNPGLLSLRAAGNIKLNQTINDAFTLGARTKQVLVNGDTWSYNIVSGADLTGASLRETQNSVSGGNLGIGRYTSIRTGTGDIYLAAAGDISLADATATVYTTGRPVLDGNGQIAAYPYALPPTLTTFKPQFADQGGNVSLIAGGNINGASSPQVVSDWLQRIGNGGSLPTAWSIDFGAATPSSAAAGNAAGGAINAALGFYENIGALGGGNVSVNAGGNIRDLSVMLPTSAISAVVNGVSVLQEFGGGNLSVKAGGDIGGGVFYVEKGVANIEAKGAIAGTAASAGGPVLVLGDSQMNLKTGQGIALGAVANAFVIPEIGVKSGQVDYFTSYTAASAVNLQSLSGDIALNNATSLITDHLQACFALSCIAANLADGAYLTTNNSLTDQPALSLYPANLSGYALGGGLRINNNMYLHAAAGGSFNLLALNDVTMASNTELLQLDADPSLFLSLANPSAGVTDWAHAEHAKQPVHAGDTTVNQIVSAQGGIIGLNEGGQVVSAKALAISAAQDLKNISLAIQNLNSPYQDASSISLGGDLIFSMARDPVSGNFSGFGSIAVSGPGRLDIWAGGNVNLGFSDGIVSEGGLSNPALLSSPGADITLLAGYQLAKNEAGLNDYLQAYVANSAYQDKLSAQLAVLTQQPATSANLQLIQDLRDLLAAIANARGNLIAGAASGDRLEWALPILFDQFRLAATEVNTSMGAAAYQIGYDAIKLLFPNPGSGDIVLDFSQIQTLQGGNINLLAPGGKLNAGLASFDVADLKLKDSSKLGVVTQAQGNINILTGGDVLVNHSRIMTLESGDITVWSSYGNIDAGRGAQSALGAQRPIASFDVAGNLTLAYPPNVSDSGIRARSAYKSAAVGNVTLLAPQGVVNASEAGIGGNDITIAAQQVIGAANIQASGNTLGVPTAQAQIALPDNSGGAAASAGKTAGGSLFDEDAAAAEQRAKKAAILAVISTQLVGFGACNISDVRNGAAGCGGK